MYSARCEGKLLVGVARPRVSMAGHHVNAICRAFIEPLTGAVNTICSSIGTCRPKMQPLFKSQMGLDWIGCGFILSRVHWAVSDLHLNPFFWIWFGFSPLIQQIRKEIMLSTECWVRTDSKYFFLSILCLTSTSLLWILFSFFVGFLFSSPATEIRLAWWLWRRGARL